MIRPSRGDRKPCTLAGCDGTMQFGRRAGSVQQPAGHADDGSGWSCDGGGERNMTPGRQHLTLVSRRAGAGGDSAAGTGDASATANTDRV